MKMMETIVMNLAIPFIILAMLSVMIDKFTLVLQEVMRKIPFLPDKFEWSIAYFIVLVSGYIVCWQLDFALFRYFSLEAKHVEFDWLLTALIISGGSSFLRSQFSMIESLPSGLYNLSATFRKFMPSKSSKQKSEE